ncbi:MAG: fimbria/pilus periplasmic chaperone [Gammaproteobacteria bacterium]|nr:fimbria/pilus periplasmic chaperone [Gammaproteobacteria bacterium]MDH5651623.1 fimbria/pilus periplasmic chaperone [Gammaproteobacteria bacterium]
MQPGKFFSLLSLRLRTTLLFIGVLLPMTDAAANLLISPTRVVFDKHTRTTSISVVNAGTETNTYRIEFVQRRMTTDGGFEPIKQAKPGEQFADQMIRYSPRQVTLQPGQSQAVRLMLRKPPNLADGEYRSHMLFRAIPKAAATSVQNQRKDDNAISIQLTPIMGISIPVIVRHGQTGVTIGFDKLRYYPDNATVLFDMQRSGNMSVYGDITILFTSKSGQSLVLKKINGLAVYSPNTHRRLSVQVNAPNGVKIEHGILTVQYHETKEAGGKLIHEQSIQVP